MLIGRIILVPAGLIIARVCFPKDLELIRTDCAQLVNTGRLWGEAPRSLMLALMTGEDRKFCFHCGLDLLAVIRSLYRFLRGARLAGGSTIEQQLVRTVRHRYERSIRRKFSEIVLAIALQRSFTKRQLIQCYLEVAYFGWRMNGFRQALLRLRLPEQDLSLEDASRVVAMLKYPLPASPSRMRINQISARQQNIIESASLVVRRSFCVGSQDDSKF